MPHDVRIAITCPDRTGLLSAVTGRLFDMGADIGDASFAVLGRAAEFTAVARLPEDLQADDVAGELSALAELEGATISIAAFALGAAHNDSGHVTHRIEVRGTDRPGLVARLTETFSDYEANIERMDCERVATGTEGDYLIRIEARIPPARAETCLAAIDNVAQSLGLHYTAEPV